MMAIVVNGARYEGWKQVSVFRSVETVSGKFSFTTTAKLGVPFPIQSGAPCQIFIGNTAVMTGFVDEVSVNYSADSHDIEITGRDATADLIDSTIGPGIDLKGPISLQSVITRVLSNMGLGAIKVSDRVGALAPFTGNEIVSAEIDKQGFEFIESFARQRQVYLTSDGAGGMMLVRAGAVAAMTPLINDISSPTNNNILESSYSDNRSDRYGRYVVYSQRSTTGIGIDSTGFLSDASNPDVNSGNQEAANLDNQATATVLGSASDPEIRARRVLHLTNEEAASTQTSFDRAAWERNTRRGKGKKYTTTVQGFHQDKNMTRLWMPNEVITINDAFCDISARLIAWSVEWKYSLDSGSTTTLECVPPESLTLLPTPKKGKKKKEPIGNELEWEE